MAYSITQLENNLTNSLVALDNNFTTFGALVPIPCGISGTNVLTLTQNTAGLVPTPTITAYTTGMLFTGIASATNTGPAAATVGVVGTLNIYKDTLAGPQLLAGNEIVIGCAISLLYDAALNLGAGGFHLLSSTAITNTSIKLVSVQINNATLTNLLSGNSPTLTFTATPGWSSQDQLFTLSGQGTGIPAVGDFIQVNPPSLAAIGVSYMAMVTAVGSVSSVSSVASVNVRLINAASASLASNSGIYRYLATRAVP